MLVHSCVGLVVLIACGATGAQVVHPPSYPIFGATPSEFFGSSVSGAGDVNGDGFDDLIVGASGEDMNGEDAGAARVLCGATGLTLHTFRGESPDDRFGGSVSGAGDVDGDGFDDVIVGAPEDDNTGLNSGSAFVFSGATGLLLHTFNGGSSGDLFGRSVSGAGDVNGDGFDDVIVGAHFDDIGGVNTGSATVFSGATGAVLHTFSGDSTNDQLGYSVSGAGDVNGDGLDDLIAGIWRDDNSGKSSGAARVYSGATGAILHTFNGDSFQDLFGIAVSGAGDVDGDGFDDLIVGAIWDDDNGEDTGSARVFSGATGAILHHFDGDAPGGLFGISVSGAGDVNGDGFDDVIVGAAGTNDGGAVSGLARVFSGATGAVLYTFNGASPADQFGLSVSGAGDVNGDGFDDMIVGAPVDGASAPSAGSVRVFVSYEVPGSAKPCPGDLDGDGDADFADLNQVISNFNTSCAP